MRITDQMQTTCFPAGRNTIEYTLILPGECMSDQCHGLVLWLHGYQERSEQILQHQALEQLAQQYGLAVAIPDVPDTYYLDQPWNQALTESFLTAEFLPALRAKYPLPASSERTFVAGISMGGFGSLLLGSHHPELFGRIAAVSGAFIINDLLIGNPEVTGPGGSMLAHFQDLFGELPSLADDSKRNPESAALQALTEGNLPPVFLACGTGDMLWSRNRKLYHRLREHGAYAAWTETEGSHSWECFEKLLPALFEWLAQ